MGNYSKWDKFAADLDSDTDKEEERQLTDFTKKVGLYIHIPAKDFSTKEQLCKILEDVPEFEPPSSSAAGVASIDGDELEPGVESALKRYGWSSIGSQNVPGYGAASQGDDIWRVFFDDNFLSSQKQRNPGARGLLGVASLGSFIISCLDRKTGTCRPI